MKQLNDTIPHGFCQCGCGQRTNLHSRTRPQRGYVKGQPADFLPGHSQPFTGNYDFLTSPELLPRIDQLIDRSAGPNECWPYLGTTNRGYGYAHVPGEGRTMRVSRVVLMRKIGRRLETCELACHHCDNPTCCNPEHLFVGTNQDNMIDASNKHRLSSGDEHWARKNPDKVKRGADHPLVKNPSKAARGERMHNAKLTDDAVRIIRSKRLNGTSTADLAAEFGVSKALILMVLRREIWKHVGDI